MLEKIHILPRHPLSRFYAHQYLPMGDKNVYSIEMAMKVMFLKNEGRTDLADELLTREELRWDPPMIASWISQTDAAIVANANFTKALDSTVSLFMEHQMSNPESGFRVALLKVIDAAKNPENLEFPVYSSSNDERIWSCGLKFKEKDRPYRGRNLYGKLLSGIVRKYINGEHFASKPIIVLDSNAAKIFQPHKRSVLVIGDSQCRLLAKIECGGEVVALGGGRFREMLNVIESGNFDLADFKYVIIYGGTNEQQDDHRRQTNWRQLKNRLVSEAERDRDPGSIVFVTNFDHPKLRGSGRLAQQIYDDFQGTNVKCLNWRHTQNHFLAPNAQIKVNLFHRDGFHLNTDGARIMWQQIAEFHAELKMFNITFHSQPVSVAKDIFDKVPQGKKRRME